jgi:hypothetical protein
VNAAGIISRVPISQCLSKIHFNGAGASANLDQLHAISEKSWSFAMSNTSAKVALAAFVILATPAASFARMPGQAGSGNVPISGIAPGPANAGGMNNIGVDPSGIGNASRMAPLPQPRIAAPVIPKFK